MKFVNKYQTKEERKFKYWLLKELGECVAIARWKRDFNFSTLLRQYEGIEI